MSTTTTGMRDTGVVPSAAARWGLVVPVKRLALAKTRLGPPHGPYGEAARQDFALAFAADVVTAALGCPLVGVLVVVTDDPLAAATLGGLGAEIVADSPDAGHNAALEHGAALARSRFHAGGVATLSADLPCLTAGALTAALGQVADGVRAFVPDASGSGTTLLAAGIGAALGAAYGPGSAERHRRSGAAMLDVPAGLRLDVDTAEDLAGARALGVGPATAALLAALASRVA